LQKLVEKSRIEKVVERLVARTRHAFNAPAAVLAAEPVVVPRAGGAGDSKWRSMMSALCGACVGCVGCVGGRTCETLAEAQPGHRIETVGNAHLCSGRCCRTRSGVAIGSAPRPA